MTQTSLLDLKNKKQLFVVHDKYTSLAETCAETKIKARKPRTK